MRIGVFDSGIGGLTVLEKLIKKYSNCEYIYYGDTKNVPFGNKSIEELKIISSKIVESLLNKNVDIIVVACGTISSNLIDYLKSKYNIPIYDIISGTIEYINKSNYEDIVVLCTERTKDSKVFEDRINKNVEVISCSNLASLIESNRTGDIELYIKDKVQKIDNKDLMILGCTHYPLIIDLIKKYTKTKILDMADYINLDCDSDTKFNLELYFSKIDDLLIKNVNRILNSYKYTIKNK